MIFNFRGTSGSGKSFLTRRIMQTYPESLMYYKKGRKQPYYYKLVPTIGDYPKLAVIGHYNTACGGCDTITLMDDVDDLVRKLHSAGNHVIFEGVIFSTEYPRTSKMIKDGLPLIIINLTTPLDICLEGVNQRRLARNPNATPVNPMNTTKRIGSINKCNDRLRGDGGIVLDMDREAAFYFVINQINPEWQLHLRKEKSQS